MSFPCLKQAKSCRTNAGVFAPILIFLLLIAPAGFAAAQPASPPDPDEAPSFTLVTTEGDALSLADLHGRVVVLNFWATWCPPCREEIPHFIELQKSFGHDDVVFVGVSLDKGHPGLVQDFIDEMDINYPIAIDDGTVEADYGPFPGIPVTFLIDREGRIQAYAPGMLTREQLIQPLELLIDGKPLQ